MTTAHRFFIIDERLAALDSLDLLNGGHDPKDAGKAMCVMEAAAWIAGEPHTDHPQCVSPVLTSYMIRLNDRWDDEKRQTLKPYIPRLIGTAGDGQDEARLRIARTALLVDALPAWLVLAGMDDEAEQVRSWAAEDGLEDFELRDRLWALRAKTWAARSARLDAIRTKVRELVKEKLASKPADADAAAVAVAVADAAAVAAAVAVAAAAADAAADAAAAAVAAAAAAADAAADADYWTIREAAYKAAKEAWTKRLAESTDPKMIAVRDLAAKHDRLALDLLERMIDPSKAA